MIPHSANTHIEEATMKQQQDPVEPHEDNLDRQKEKGPTMAYVSLRDSLLAADAYSIAMRMIVLDTLWTNHLGKTDARAEDDIAALETLANELCRLIAQLPALGAQLRRIVEALDAEELDARYRSLSFDLLRSDVVDELRASVAQRGGLRTYLLDSVTFLEEHGPATIDGIRETVTARKAATETANAEQGTLSCAYLAVAFGFSTLVFVHPALAGTAGWWYYDTCRATLS
jgi:hypothetical protein